MSRPLVSVVTPFHNTAPYLAECIKSVLGQSHGRFEYILVDNCSTDGSGEIAAEFAARDQRVRLIRRSKLLTQVQNYNAALNEIAPDSSYCKIVQADDRIFPDCLHLMLAAFEQTDSIGLVSSYYLKGVAVRGSGFPAATSFMPGRDAARFYLRTGVFVFGSPTTVMYRSSLVRGNPEFYDESLLHEDTEKCMQILQKADFGFVPQVLSFLRTENESISSAARSFQPEALDWYIIAQRYGPVFLPPEEAAALTKASKHGYYAALAREALRLREAAFWKYHRDGLRTLGQELDRGYLAREIARRVAWLAVNPGEAAARVFGRERRNGTAHASPGTGAQR